MTYERSALGKVALDTCCCCASVVWSVTASGVGGWPKGIHKPLLFSEMCNSLSGKWCSLGAFALAVLFSSYN